HEVRRLRSDTGLQALTFSPDGRRLLTCSTKHQLTVWDPQTGQDPFILPAYARRLSQLVVSPDGQRLACGTGDPQTERGAGSVKIWDSVTGQLLLTLRGHRKYVCGVAFSPDGKRLASASYDGTVKFWDSFTGQLLRTLEVVQNGTVGGVAFRPDGQQFAT